MVQLLLVEPLEDFSVATPTLAAAETVALLLLLLLLLLLSSASLCSSSFLFVLSIATHSSANHKENHANGHTTTFTVRLLSNRGFEPV